MKVRVDATIDEDLVKWMDKGVESGRFASRSHALRVALKELRKKDTVRF